MENHVLLIQLFMEKYKNTKENETILAIGIAFSSFRGLLKRN
jgi:hypothetical protein